MSSENSKTSKPHIFKLKLRSKLDLKVGEKVIALSNLSICYTWRNMQKKAHTITKNLKYPHQHGMMNLNCLMDRILCQIFKIISNTS